MFGFTQQSAQPQQTFGQLPQTQPAAGFGAQSTQPSGFGQSTFGTTQASQPATFSSQPFSFGISQPAAPQPSLFGAATWTTNALGASTAPMNTFGASATTNLFGAGFGASTQLSTQPISLGTQQQIPLGTKFCDLPAQHQAEIDKLEKLIQQQIIIQEQVDLASFQVSLKEISDFAKKIDSVLYITNARNLAF